VFLKRELPQLTVLDFSMIFHLVRAQADFKYFIIKD
jgi:hypothetical protein